MALYTPAHSFTMGLHTSDHLTSSCRIFTRCRQLSEASVYRPKPTLVPRNIMPPKNSTRLIKGKTLSVDISTQNDTKSESSEALTRSTGLQTPSSFPTIRACLFDMDGLLLNTEDMYTACNNEVLHRCGRPSLPWSVKAQMQGRPGSEVCSSSSILARSGFKALPYLRMEKSFTNVEL